MRSRHPLTDAPDPDHLPDDDAYDDFRAAAPPVMDPSTVPFDVPTTGPPHPGPPPPGPSSRPGPSRRSGRSGPPSGSGRSSTPRAAGAGARLQAGQAPAPPRHAMRGPRRGPWPEAAVAVAAVVTFGWRVSVPSPWRDEAATMAACRRSFGQLLAMARDVDLVHLAFYLLAKCVLPLSDTVTAVRLVSVVAMAAAAVVLTALGRRAGGTALGLTAGAVLVALPVMSRWAQDARPIALFTLLTTVATGLLLEALRDPPSHPVRWWAGYAIALVALGGVNVLALLVVPAHALFLVLTHPVRRLRPFLASAGAAGLPLAAWIAVTFTQRGQVSWIEPPHLYDLTALYINAFGSKLVLPVVVVAGLAVVVLSRGLPGGGAGQAFVLGAAWSAVPPVLLWLVSLRMPMWDAHYLIFVMPGLALLMAAEVALLVAAARRRDRGAVLTGPVAALVVAVVAAVGVPDQLAYRDPSTGHGDDVRGVATYLEANGRPGDGLLFAPSKLRSIALAYPEQFVALDDLALAQGPKESTTLRGVEVDAAALPDRLLGRDRIWLVTRDSAPSPDAPSTDTVPTDTAASGTAPSRAPDPGSAEAIEDADDARKIAALESGYHLVQQVEVPSFRISLYEPGKR